MQQGPLRNGLQPLVAVLVAEANDAQTRAESLLGMRFGSDDALKQSAVSGPILRPHSIRREGVYCK